MDIKELRKDDPHDGGDHGHGGKDEIILDVATPKGPWKGAFPKTTKSLSGEFRPDCIIF